MSGGTFRVSRGADVLSTCADNVDEAVERAVHVFRWPDLDDVHADVWRDGAWCSAVEEDDEETDADAPMCATCGDEPVADAGDVCESCEDDGTCGTCGGHGGGPDPELLCRACGGSGSRGQSAEDRINDMADRLHDERHDRW